MEHLKYKAVEGCLSSRADTEAEVALPGASEAAKSEGTVSEAALASDPPASSGAFQKDPHFP